MVSLQPLRDAITGAQMSCHRVEKILVKAARREATLTEAWKEATVAQEFLRKFDNLMAHLNAQHDAAKT